MPKICLVSIDDLRYDGLSCHSGNPYADTPTLDRFASDGADYRRAYSTASYTPSPHASMLTGLYPNRHKVKTFFYKLPEGIQTLPQVLGEKGYKTYAWVEHPTFACQDLLRGFDRAYEPLQDPSADLYKTLAYLDVLPENLFLFMHLFDVHKPYYYSTGGIERSNAHYLNQIWGICGRQGIEPEYLWSEARTEAESMAGYLDLDYPLQELAFYRALDHCLRNQLRQRGRLLEEIIPLYTKGVNNFDRVKFSHVLELVEEFDLIIVTADHGEGIVGDDFVNITGTTEEGIHVPLLTNQPIDDSELLKSLVSPVDIMPTILDFLDMPTGESLDGISLFSPDPDRVIYSDTWDYRGVTNNFPLTEEPTSDFLASACAMRWNQKCTLEGDKYSGDMELRHLLDKYLGEYR